MLVEPARSAEARFRGRRTPPIFLPVFEPDEGLAARPHLRYFSPLAVQHAGQESVTQSRMPNEVRCARVQTATRNHHRKPTRKENFLESSWHSSDGPILKGPFSTVSELESESRSIGKTA